MFKFKIVRQLALLLVIKLALVFLIKDLYFDAPVIPEKSEAVKKTSNHFFNKKTISKE